MSKIIFKFSKLITNPKEILSQIPNGSTVMCGGFGLCGIPENAFKYLVELGTKDLIVVSNTCGIYVK